MTLTLMSLSCSDLIECLPRSCRPVSRVKGKSFTNRNIWSLRSLFGNIASLCLLHLQVNCAPKLGRTLQPARGSCLVWMHPMNYSRTLIVISAAFSANHVYLRVLYVFLVLGWFIVHVYNTNTVTSSEMRVTFLSLNNEQSYDRKASLKFVKFKFPCELKSDSVKIKKTTSKYAIPAIRSTFAHTLLYTYMPI